MATKQSGLYMILNITNGRRYVGATNDRVIRWRHHRYKLRNGKHENQHLQNAWRTYGEESFRFVWIKDVPEEDLAAEEQKLLDGNPDGYNISQNTESFMRGIQWTDERKQAASIACTGRKHSEETRKKIGDVQRGKPKKPRTADHCQHLSESMKGKKNFLGHTHSEETRAKLRENALGNQNFLGRKHTDATKAKISAKHRGKKLSAEHCRKMSEQRLGNKHSEETKRKMSLSHKARLARLRFEHEQQSTTQGSAL